MRQVLPHEGIIRRADKVEDDIPRRGHEGDQREPNHLALIHRLVQTRADKALLHEIEQRRGGPDLECREDALDEFPDEEGDESERMPLPEEGEKVLPDERDELEGELDGGYADDTVFSWWVDGARG